MSYFALKMLVMLKPLQSDDGHNNSKRQFMIEQSPLTSIWMAPKLGKIQEVNNHIDGSLVSISPRVKLSISPHFVVNSQKFAQKKLVQLYKLPINLFCQQTINFVSSYVTFLSETGHRCWSMVKRFLKGRSRYHKNTSHPSVFKKH